MSVHLARLAERVRREGRCSDVPDISSFRRAFREPAPSPRPCHPGNLVSISTPRRPRCLRRRSPRTTPGSDDGGLALPSFYPSRDVLDEKHHRSSTSSQAASPGSTYHRHDDRRGNSGHRDPTIGPRPRPLARCPLWTHRRSPIRPGLDFLRNSGCFLKRVRSSVTVSSPFSRARAVHALDTVAARFDSPGSDAFGSSSSRCSSRDAAGTPIPVIAPRQQDP